MYSSDPLGDWSVRIGRTVAWFLYYRTAAKLHCSNRDRPKPRVTVQRGECVVGQEVVASQPAVSRIIGATVVVNTFFFTARALRSVWWLPLRESVSACMP